MCFISVDRNMKHFVVEEAHIFRGELCSDRNTQKLVQTGDTILRTGRYEDISVLVYIWKTNAVLRCQNTTYPLHVFTSVG